MPEKNAVRNNCNECNNLTVSSKQPKCGDVQGDGLLQCTTTTSSGQWRRFELLQGAGDALAYSSG